MSVIDRRRFMKALGLSGLGAYAASAGLGRRASADPGDPPRRVVFLVTSHGHVWDGWHMPVAGATETAPAFRDLAGLDVSDFSRTLQPLHDMRRKLTPIEGLAHTTVLGEFARQTPDGGTDFNNHTISYAGLLTHEYAQQIGGGAYCRGGGISIDQLLANRTGGGGRFSSLTWDIDPEQRYHREFSYTAAGRATPAEAVPSRAYEDLLGLRPPVAVGRDEIMRSAGVSAINAATEQYDRVAAGLGADGRRRLEQHRDLLSDLARAQSLTAPSSCSTDFEAVGHVTEQFLRLAELALSCDLTRVITFVMPVLRPADFGYDPGLALHGELAHASIRGGTGAFSQFAADAMTEYNRWYATRVADFLARLDAIPDGDGSLLDNTAVVWLSELGTPTHEHRDVCSVVAGASDFFQHGRYVRMPRSIRGPASFSALDPFVGDPGMIGPSTGHLFVSLLRWMGFEDNSFGLSSVQRSDGTDIDVSGPLSVLHR